MRQIVNEISKGKNIDSNLVKYAKGFSEINNKFAYIRLALNYYTFYQMQTEQEDVIGVDISLELSKLNEIISTMDSDDIGKVEAIRENVIKKMQALTYYVDKYNVYEFAYNRVEYKYHSFIAPTNYSDEEFTRKIMKYILDDEDSTVINTKICEIIGQLPVRMTKNKFFEYVNTGLDIYKQAEKSSLKDFLYRIRTSAILEEKEEYALLYPEINDVFNEFDKYDFKNITEDELEEFSEKLSELTSYIDENVTANMMIQELINDVLLVLYTKDEQLDDKVTNVCNEIVSETNLLFSGKFAHKTMEELEGMFVELEGEQEELYQKIVNYDIVEQILEKNQEHIVKNNLVDVYKKIKKLPLLNSDSMFVELDRVEDKEIVDEEYLEQMKNELFDEFTNKFSNCQRIIKKSIMSATLSELPVFFNNISELQDYIYNSLEGCTDDAEKKGCLEIISLILVS